MNIYKKYKKIIFIIITIVIIGVFGWYVQENVPLSYQQEVPDGESSFNKSFGTTFKIGAFTTIVATSSSGIVEKDCKPLKPVIASVLHDISERLKDKTEGSFLSLTDIESVFEVNQSTLQLFCNTTATVTLSAKDGKILFLQKIPFSRSVRAGGTEEDAGTRVHINATVAPNKSSLSTTVQTTFGDILIPDKYLETSSQ